MRDFVIFTNSRDALTKTRVEINNNIFYNLIFRVFAIALLQTINIKHFDILQSRIAYERSNFHLIIISRFINKNIIT